MFDDFRHPLSAICQWMAGDRWGPAVSRGWLLGLPQSSQVAGPDMFVWDEREWAAREVQAHSLSV